MQTDPPVRLTIINQFYVPDISPTAHLAASLAESRASSDQVTVIASAGGYVESSRSGADSKRTANPRVFRIWTPQLGKKRKLSRIIDYLSFYLGAALRVLTLPRQDVIVCLTTPPFIGLTAVLHKILHPGTKLILWNMDCYPEVMERTGMTREGSLPARMMRRINRFLFNRLDHLVVLDSAMQDLLAGYRTRSPALPVTIIPNWERASFFPANVTPPPWSEIDTLGLRNRFVVLYLGNTGFGHSFDTVLQAAQLLRSEPVVFLFIGGGSRWQDIEAGVRELGLQNVVMRGYVPKEQTPSVMAAAQCALITLQDASLGVMSPSKLHANLAMGLPVIYVGPTRSNVDDAIEQFRCGISVRHGDAERVAEWIRAMIHSPKQRDDLSRSARRAFDEAYCDTQTLARFDEVLDRVHAGRAAQSSTEEAALR